MSLRKAWRVFLIAGCCGLLALSARAAETPSTGLQTVTFRGQGFVIKTIDPRKADLRLYWNDDKGQLLRDFAGLDKYVSSQGERLVFAANAGMFQPDSKPVGLLMLKGAELSPLNLNEGTGNFFMKPNGVFVINEKKEALIVESGNYETLLSRVVWATQSGPLLVHGGDIHPDFNADSKNINLRSGVGVTKDGIIVFAISQRQVNFYDFASLFLEKLHCPNALYLDGTISAFYVPGQKDPMPRSFGPMFGLIEKP